LTLLKVKYKEERDIWDESERLRNEEYKKELETILETNERREKDGRELREDARRGEEGSREL
jgi:hypothetical protein